MSNRSIQNLLFIFDDFTNFSNSKSYRKSSFLLDQKNSSNQSIQNHLFIFDDFTNFLSTLRKSNFSLEFLLFRALVFCFSRARFESVWILWRHNNKQNSVRRRVSYILLRVSNVEQLTPRNLSLKGGTGAIFVYLRLPYLAKYSIFIKGLYIIIDKADSEL